MIDIKKCEKYAEKIADAMVDNNCDFIKKYVLKSQCLECQNLICSDCIKIVKQWLLEEYEPEIDWTKIPVDTPVLVKDKTSNIWKERRFMCYQPNFRYNFWCFNHGSDSQKSCEATGWECCKLLEGVDPTPFLKEV